MTYFTIQYIPLYVLQRNFYKSSFEPPKRATPKEKKLSDNIKRFLDKQKTEEEEKLRRSREKKLELIGEKEYENDDFMIISH